MKTNQIQLVKNWPKKTGVYLMMNKNNQVIYVGKAKNLASRVRSYFTTSDSLKKNFLVNQINRMDYILTHTEAEALLLEASLVKKHKPRYNVRLKDDKSYPYICVSMSDPFPRFYLERKVKKNKNIYFGPYTMGQTVRNIMRFLNEQYQIRDCSNGFMKSRKTPCLTHQMGYCTAPCVQYVSQKQYAKQVQKALSFLRGSGVKTLKDLKSQMKKQADKECFEQALLLKNRADSIEAVWEKQYALDPSTGKNIDIVSYFTDNQHLSFEILHVRSGRWIGHHSHFEREFVWKTQNLLEENLFGFLVQYYFHHLVPKEVILPSSIQTDALKTFQKALRSISSPSVTVHIPKATNEKKWMNLAIKNAKNHFSVTVKKEQALETALLDIQRIFKLPQYPHRIECYDISHFQSQVSYASQVVFEEGVKKTSEYRLYKLPEINDDYQSMRQVLGRRFSRDEIAEPQLVLIDGGKGQLQTAFQVLKEKNKEHIPLVAIAKNKEKWERKKEDRFYQIGRKNAIRIKENQKSYQILVQLRDEAHRFAISRHRKKLRDRSLESVLEKIKGVGEKRKIILLREFHSIRGIQKAGVKKVAKVGGISPKLAQSIIAFLK